MDRVDLWTLLHDIGLQYEIIRLGMLDLRAGDAVPELDWLGNPISQTVSSKRRKPVTNTLPDILARADAEDGPAEEPGVEFGPLVDTAERMVVENGLVWTTWLVLFLIMATDRLKDMIRRGTRPDIAEMYLEGFDDRIGVYICGKISYAPRTRDQRSKSGKVISAAIPPSVAVAEEWAYLDSVVRRATAP